MRVVRTRNAIAWLLGAWLGGAAAAALGATIWWRPVVPAPSAPPPAAPPPAVHAPRVHDARALDGLEAAAAERAGWPRTDAVLWDSATRLPSEDVRYDLPPIGEPSCSPRAGWHEIGVTRSGPERLHVFFRLVRFLPEAEAAGLSVLSPETLAAIAELRPVAALVMEDASGRCFVRAARALAREATPAEIARSLGHWEDSAQEVLAVHHLARDPRESVLHLVGELDPLRDLGPDLDARVLHVIRVVNALEALTGQCFEFVPEAPLTEAEEVCFSEHDRAGFWGYRMSWAHTCLAPLGVREKVVAAWRAWASVHARTFHPARPPLAVSYGP